MNQPMPGPTWPDVQQVPWRGLTWQTYDLTYQALQPGYVGRQVTAAWRGALGHALRRMDPDLYYRVFENRIAPSHPYARRFRTGPVPYLCRMERDYLPQLQTGDELTLTLVLVGQAQQAWQALQPILQAVGQAGLGPERVPLQLSSFTPRAAENWLHLAQQPATARLQLTFLTPLIQKQRPPAGQPLRLPLPKLVHQLAERATLLAHFFAGGELQDDYQTWKTLAEQAQPEAELLVWQELRRHSQRQQKTLHMGGLAGELRYQALPAPLAPLLRLGEHLHVGKGAPWGMGRLHCRWRFPQT